MEDILHTFCGQFSSNASKCSEEKLEDFRSYMSKESFRNRVPLLIYLVFVGVVGLVGNTIVVLVYWFKFTSSSKRVFILSMALCDLLINIVTIPIKVVAIRHAYDTNVWVCKAELMAEAYPAGLSMLMLYAVAVDRCNRVCRPHGRQLRVRQSLYIVVALTVAAIALFLPINVAYGATRWGTAIAGVQVIMCSIVPTQSLAVTAHTVIVYSIFGIGFLLLLACYGSIFVKVRSSNRRVAKSSVATFKKVSNTNAKLSWRASGHAQPLPAPDKSELKDVPDDSTVGPRPRFEAQDLPMGPPEPQPVAASYVNTHSNTQAATFSVVSFEPACTAEQLRASFPSASRDSVFAIKNASSTRTWVEKQWACAAQLSRSQSPYISSTTTACGSRTMISGAGKSRPAGHSTRMMAVLSVVFLVDWVPFLITRLKRTQAYLWCEQLTECGDDLFDIAHLSFYINSMANPIVYSFTHKKFRDNCVDLFRDWCRKLSIKRLTSMADTSVSRKNNCRQAAHELR